MQDPARGIRRGMAQERREGRGGNETLCAHRCDSQIYFVLVVLERSSIKAPVPVSAHSWLLARPDSEATGRDGREHLPWSRTCNRGERLTGDQSAVQVDEERGDRTLQTSQSAKCLVLRLGGFSVRGL